MEWLPEHHLVFFLLDLAVQLDLEAIHRYYRQKDPRGEKAYDPRMMVVLLLYAYGVGLSSSRKIEKACWDAAFRVLTGNQQLDHSRISDFRPGRSTWLPWPAYSFMCCGCARRQGWSAWAKWRWMAPR